MTQRRISVQLTDDLVALLDRRAAAEGISRSALIRKALEDFTAADREAEIDRQIIEGYTRMPQGGEYDIDEWGDLGAFNEFHSRESLKALAEEERAAGHEPW